MPAAPHIRFSDDGRWAWVGFLAVYSREDGTFSIGRLSGARAYSDVETGFQNMDAAIDQAEWLVTDGRDCLARLPASA